jgi:hypothetical protein
MACVHLIHIFWAGLTALTKAHVSSQQILFKDTGYHTSAGPVCFTVTEPTPLPCPAVPADCGPAPPTAVAA